MATLTFEIELSLTGRLEEPEPDVNYGGGCEDADIEDIGIVTLVPAPKAEQGSHPRGVWQTTSIMTGIDMNAPEIQKLIANIMAIKEQEIIDAIVEAGSE